MRILSLREYSYQNNGVRLEPCHRRFRVFIDQYGDIYPCAGLVGVEYAKMGNIISIKNMLFAKTTLDLQHLAKRGPDVTELAEVTINNKSGLLPPICASHRSYLIKQNLDSF